MVATNDTNVHGFGEVYTRSNGALARRYPSEVRLAAINLWKLCRKYELVRHADLLDIAFSNGSVTVKPKAPIAGTQTLNVNIPPPAAPLPAAAAAAAALPAADQPMDSPPVPVLSSAPATSEQAAYAEATPTIPYPLDLAQENANPQQVDMLEVDDGPPPASSLDGERLSQEPSQLSQVADAISDDEPVFVSETKASGELPATKEHLAQVACGQAPTEQDINPLPPASAPEDGSPLSGKAGSQAGDMDGEEPDVEEIDGAADSHRVLALKLSLPPAPFAYICLATSFSKVWGTYNGQTHISRQFDGLFKARRTRLQALEIVMTWLWDQHKAAGHSDDARPDRDSLADAIKMVVTPVGPKPGPAGVPKAPVGKAAPGVPKAPVGKAAPAAVPGPKAPPVGKAAPAAAPGPKAPIGGPKVGAAPKAKAPTKAKPGAPAPAPPPAAKAKSKPKPGAGAAAPPAKKAKGGAT